MTPEKVASATKTLKKLAPDGCDRLDSLIPQSSSVREHYFRNVHHKDDIKELEGLKGGSYL